MELEKVNKNAGALVFSLSTKRFLFLLRNSAKKFKGTWGLVGGKLEKDEQPVAGLLREVQEELSTDLSKNKIIPIETFTSDNKKFIYYTFLIVVEQEFIPTLNDEHSGYTWVDLKNCPVPMHPGVGKTVNFNSVLTKLQVIRDLL